MAGIYSLRGAFSSKAEAPVIKYGKISSDLTFCPSSTAGYENYLPMCYSGKWTCSEVCKGMNKIHARFFPVSYNR